MLKRFITVLFFVFITTTANAMVIIEDEETLNYISSLTKPIYKAANIPFDKNKIHIVLDDSINAFVISGSHMFINTGLIIQAKNSNEISGVIAHEAGHIKAGHIFKQKLKIKELNSVSLASMIIAGLAGAATGSPELAMAGVLGSQGALTGQYFEYKKEDERAADNFAITTLKKANIPNEDLKNFLKRLQIQNQAQGTTERSYYTTHPLTQERIDYLNHHKTTGQSKNEAELKNIQAKLFAFTMPPKETIKKYYNKNHYATAIATFKALEIKEATDYAKWLITTQPNNPYYHELLAQIYYETAKPKEAVNSYQKALDLLPNSTYYKIYLAQALLESSSNKSDAQKAINLLKQAAIMDKTAKIYLLQARAYGILEDKANALLSSAQYSMAIGNISVAKKQAKQAKQHTNDPIILLKADDIINLTSKKSYPRG